MQSKSYFRRLAVPNLRVQNNALDIQIIFKNLCYNFEHGARESQSLLLYRLGYQHKVVRITSSIMMQRIRIALPFSWAVPSSTPNHPYEHHKIMQVIL